MRFLALDLLQLYIENMRSTKAEECGIIEKIRTNDLSNGNINLPFALWRPTTQTKLSHLFHRIFRSKSLFLASKTRYSCLVDQLLLRILEIKSFKFSNFTNV